MERADRTEAGPPLPHLPSLEAEGLSEPCSLPRPPAWGPAPKHPFLGVLCSTLQKGVRLMRRGQGPGSRAGLGAGESGWGITRTMGDPDKFRDSRPLKVDM